MSLLPQTPSQTVGPFFHDALMRNGVDDLDPLHVAGDPIRVVGRVLDGAGESVDDALLEVWQPDGRGRYRHPVDPRHREVADSFVGFGRVATDDLGQYQIDTVLPGPVGSPAEIPQAAHLNILVFARGLLDLLSTRVYFADREAENATDPILGSVPAGRRRSLLADPEQPTGGRRVYRFDIVLRGPSETVFFNL
jgi:protocatechuate 3,4-dioxygenase, alpha subunit